MRLNFKIENSQDISKPWLVLINGLFAGLESWNSVVSELCEDFRLLRYDCRGQGESPKPAGPYLLEQHVDDLKELLDSLDIEECFFVGMSNGGRIAMAFTEKYPERIKAQALADTYDNISTLLKMKLNSWKEANACGGPIHRFNVAAPWIWGESFLKSNPELVSFYRKNAHLSDSKVVEALIEGAMDGEVNVKSSPVPTLLMAGDEDLLTPFSYHEEMAKNYKNAIAKKIKGGHASLLEYPQAVSETILPFLKEYL